MASRYLFGPVASRRLGVSLGIDLIPFKTCSLDCVYCECGKTTNHTFSPSTEVKLEDVIAELRSYLSTNPKLDYVTFAGSGEPLLYAHFDKVVEFLKHEFPQYKLALLTNSINFLERQEWGVLLALDLIVPSLDAVSPDVFNKINRPAHTVDLERLVKKLTDFKVNYKGKFLLEIFILPGFNDTPDEIERLVAAAKKINPDGVQLNSLDRPGTEAGLTVAPMELLLLIKEKMQPLAVEIVSKKATLEYQTKCEELEQRVVETLKRRPSTIVDLVSMLGGSDAEVKKIIEKLVSGKLVIIRKEERGEFYSYHF